MIRFRKEKANKSGWSRWVQPRADRYFMGCCDCDLVHVMQFRVGKNGQVQFRATREDNETRLQRGDGRTVNTDAHRVVVTKHQD
ncbi:hypothetical protein X766_15940 [Mesorhizobium sp. LSJC255A00]|nr:hypothetical protein X766_15940 [Mesorhizobium sp. LSJC255A00]